MATVRPWTRRGVILGLAIVFGLLALFPERYRSAATLAPSDPSTFGLSGSLNQLGAANTVFGNQAAVEITIRVAHSLFVSNAVIDRLHLLQRMHFADRVAAHRWLDRKITVRSLRGGIVQMETDQRDPQFAEEMITAYAQATRERLGAINQQQTRYKRTILEQLVKGAADRYQRAQQTYDAFRRQTRYSDPSLSIAAISSRIPQLEAAIKAKEIQLASARGVATEKNLSVIQIQTELTALRRQLAQQKALNPNTESSVGLVVGQSTKAERLEHELGLARNLYEIYNQYLLGTAVEDLTSLASLRTIEPPYVDTDRQLNITFVALFVLVILFGAAVEFYQMRPPVGASSA